MTDGVRQRGNMKYWDHEINDNTDWGGDSSTENLPVKGNRVQEYIKNNILGIKSDLGTALQGISEKFGYVDYIGGRIVFFDEQGGKELASVTLTGTSYTVEVESNKSSSFNVLTTDVSTDVTFTPQTFAVEIGSTQKVYFPEDYTFSAEVDNGSGYVDITPMDNRVRVGKTGSINVRNYLKTGANRIRIIVRGDTSEQIKTLVLTANLTTLFLTCSHRWEDAFIEGEKYTISNIFFGGNVAKTLHIKIDGREYVQNFSAQQQYINVPYSYDIEFPTHGSGVYPVEVWMTGEDVSTNKVIFNIMCVAANEISTASLVCVNDVPAQVYNYATQSLFKYATYNKTTVRLNVTSDIQGVKQFITKDLDLNVQAGVVNNYITTLQIDTIETEGVSIGFELSGQTGKITVDNSNAFIATPGANFYLQPGLKYNSSNEREKITNTAPGAIVSEYDATWSNMTWADDGWTVDSDGNKCLKIMAGSEVSVPLFKPLATSGAESQTIEFLYKAENIADETKPIMSIMSTETYSAADTRGIVLFPTRLVVLTSNEKSVVYQKLDMNENRLNHIAVVLQRNYRAIGRNLCRIYINGIENVTFEYSGTSSFVSSDYSYLRIGQQSADFNLYMMRTYTEALEPTAVLANYLNAMIDTAESKRSGIRADNMILDSGVISYDLVKKAGFNCLVYETDSDLPDLDHQSTKSLKLNLRFEYNDHPEWNVTIKGIPCDGQGTTSMKYYRWNLRNKIKDAATEWFYPNINGGLTEYGKEGYIAGYGLHPKVSTITSKKNVASSPQGHKMGACGLYDELFELCETKNMLPNEDCRVATYQNPFMAFKMSSNGIYEFIGLYTSGPDKKDKKTFGYNDTKNYPNLMMLEGPNHAPFMTRFLVPWTDDVAYNATNETLECGGEEGWDADIAAGYSTDDPADQANIMALYMSEFKPAYDAVYYNSPYIAPLPKSLEEINADVISFQAESTDGYSNKLMTFYNSDYELVYYRIKTGLYEVLPKSTHDMLEYLGLTGSPTKEQIRQARATKFKTEMPKYISYQEALYHECFCELLGISDNHAKNTYWRKFKSIAEGGKWGFNQDDMDTIFQTDNNGQDTKSYSIEPEDLNNGVEIFQGASSAFWQQLRNTYKTELRDKMKLIIENLVDLAGKYNVSATTVHESVRNIISYFFHTHSAKYFPVTAYNEDGLYTYISVWAMNPDKVYNSVPPLTQVHGDHYETERAWIERRIAYVFSKYRLGGFTGSGDDGYSVLEFTTAVPYTMEVTPAIDLYPRVSIGGQDANENIGARTYAGDECGIQIQSTGDTTVYLKALDWISSLGNLKNLVLASRGGSDEIKIAISSKKLKDITASGDEVAFNATGLTIPNGPSVETIDLRNCQTLKGQLDMSSCSRLKTVDLTGTAISMPIAPVGGRITEYKMPEGASTLFLHSLNLLEEENLELPDLDGIETLYINGMDNLNALQILFSIMNSENNNLKYITLMWNGTIDIADPADLALFRYLADNVYNPVTGEGYGAVTYINGQIATSKSKPNIQGHLTLEKAYQIDIDIITTTFPNVSVDGIQEYYQWFADSTIRNAALNSSVATDPILGIKAEDWKHNMKQTDLRGMVENMTAEERLAVTSWDELGEIEVVNGSSIQAGSYFMINKLQNLEKLVFPNNTFGSWDTRNMPNTKEVVVGENTSTAWGYSGIMTFQNWTSLEHLDVKNMYNRISGNTYSINDLCKGCTNLKDFKADTICPNPNKGPINYLFSGCVNLENVEIDDLKTSGLLDMFQGCAKLTADNCVIRNIDLSKVTTCSNLFNGCTAMTELPSWWSWNLANKCNLDSFIANTKITEFGNIATTADHYNMFNNSSLERVGNITAGTSNSGDIRSMNFPKTIVTIGDISLRDGVKTSAGNNFIAYSDKLVSIGNIDYENCTALWSAAFFYGCNKLDNVGWINIPNATTTAILGSNPTNFGGFRGLKVNATVNGDKLSAQSVHNIINEATGGTASVPITVTLHATAKARWQASEYYAADSAMAAAKHINITT